MLIAAAGTAGPWHGQLHAAVDPAIVPEPKRTRAGRYLVAADVPGFAQARGGAAKVLFLDLRTRAGAMYVGMAGGVDAVVPFVEHEPLAEQSTPPVLASPKPLQERPASAMSRLMRPVLRQVLLRGLRPVRLSHDPSCSFGGEGVAELRTLRLTGARGQQLAAWLALPGNAAASDPVPVVVALHGWGANASTLSPMVAPLVRAGMAVLLFDAANHGQSASEDFSSLPRFAEDLAAVLACLRTMPAVDAARCAVLGHSVGAAAVLLHATRHDDVRAVVSLSAFAHPAEVMARWLREHRIPLRGIGTAILDEVQQTIGARFEHIAPVHVMAQLRCPLMLVHGQQDEVVPLSDAQRLQALAPHAELLVVEGGHDLREALQPHTPRLVRFLVDHLGARKP